MTDRRKFSVIWKGPEGKVQQNSNSDLLNLLSHKEVKAYFREQKLKQLRGDVLKALSCVRRLYKTHDLSSPYHNFGHNYVTTITALRAFIGAVKLEKNLRFGDLEDLIFAASFHDTGYLRKSKYLKKSGTSDHSRKSRRYLEEFLMELGIKDEYIKRISKLQKFTDYSKWKINKDKLKGNVCAQLLVGADLMQCADVNYEQNLEILREILFTRKEVASKLVLRKFFGFSKEATKYIWKYLDSFYGGRKKNPYRKGWKRYEELLRDKYGVKIKK